MRPEAFDELPEVLVAVLLHQPPSEVGQLDDTLVQQAFPDISPLAEERVFILLLGLEPQKDTHVGKVVSADVRPQSLRNGLPEVERSNGSEHGYSLTAISDAGSDIAGTIILPCAYR